MLQVGGESGGVQPKEESGENGMLGEIEGYERLRGQMACSAGWAGLGGGKGGRNLHTLAAV